MSRRIPCALAGAVGALLLLGDARFSEDLVFRFAWAGRVLWEGERAELHRLVAPGGAAVAAAVLAALGGLLFARAARALGVRRPGAAGLLGALVLFPALDAGLLAFVAERGGESAPWYLDVGDLLRGCGAALLGVAGIGWLAGAPRPGRPGRLPERGGPALAAACLFAGLAPACLSLTALDGAPVTNDGRAYLFQAEVFAEGRLACDVGELADFFPARQVMPGPRAFAKYPPGTSLLLAPGVALGLPRLVPVLLGALVPLLVFRIARRLSCPRPLWAAWLAALSPAVGGIGVLWLSHAVTLPACLAFADLVLAQRDARERGERVRPGRLLAAGLALSVALLARPVTAAAFALPFALLLVPSAATAVALGALPGLCLFLWIDARLTGSPFTTAYELYAARVSPNDRFGTMNLGTALPYTRFNLTRLATWAHGATGGLLLAVLGGLAPGRPRRALLLVAPLVTLTAAHALHRFHGIPWVGPLYLVEAVPLLCVLSAGGLALLEERLGGRAALAAAGALVLGGALLGGEHLSAARTEARLRSAPERLAEAAGIERGVVFVRRETESERKRLALPPPDLDAEPGVVFARDLGPRNRELLARLGSPPAWRFVSGVDALVPLAADGVSPRE